jgi:hypothetical protein
MKAATPDTMKARNLTWLVMLAVFDVGLSLLAITPELGGEVTLTKVVALRTAVITVLPVLVLLLAGLLSPNFKAMLVFWKVKNPLPGSEAFTKHGPADLRIDMAALKKNVGAPPTIPKEQNAMWYRLYKMVADEGAVVEAQKSFLMCRDMAAMSLPLIFLVPPLLWNAGASVATSLIIAAVLAMQFLACAVSARHNGIRLVTNVLAIHSARKVTTRKPPASAREHK